MSWFGSEFSKITDKISTFTKEVLTEGTEEIDDPETALRVAKSQIANIESSSSSYRDESEKVENDLRSRLTHIERQYESLNNNYRHQIKAKDEEIHDLERRNIDLAQSSSMTEISLDDSHDNQFLSGDLHDFDDVISSQREIAKLRGVIARFQMEKQRQDKDGAASKGTQLDDHHLLSDYQKLKEKLFTIQDENQQTIASLQQLGEQRLHEQRQYYEEQLQQSETSNTKIDELERLNTQLHEDIAKNTALEHKLNEEIKSLKNNVIFKDSDVSVDDISEELKKMNDDNMQYELEKECWILEKNALEKSLLELRGIKKLSETNVTSENVLSSKESEMQLSEIENDLEISQKQVQTLQDELVKKTENFKFRLNGLEEDYELELTDKDEEIERLETKLKKEIEKCLVTKGSPKMKEADKSCDSEDVEDSKDLENEIINKNEIILKLENELKNNVDVIQNRNEMIALNVSDSKEKDINISNLNEKVSEFEDKYIQVNQEFTSLTVIENEHNIELSENKLLIDELKSLLIKQNGAIGEREVNISELKTCTDTMRCDLDSLKTSQVDKDDQIRDLLTNKEQDDESLQLLNKELEISNETITELKKKYDDKINVCNKLETEISSSDEANYRNQITNDENEMLINDKNDVILKLNENIKELGDHNVQISKDLQNALEKVENIELSRDEFSNNETILDETQSKIDEISENLTQSQLDYSDSQVKVKETEQNLNDYISKIREMEESQSLSESTFTELSEKYRDLESELRSSEDKHEEDMTSYRTRVERAELKLADKIKEFSMMEAANQVLTDEPLDEMECKVNTLQSDVDTYRDILITISELMSSNSDEDLEFDSVVLDLASNVNLHINNIKEKLDISETALNDYKNKCEQNEIELSENINLLILCKDKVTDLQNEQEILNRQISEDLQNHKDIMTTMEINVDNIEEELIEIKKEYTKLDEKHSKCIDIEVDVLMKRSGASSSDSSSVGTDFEVIDKHTDSSALSSLEHELLDVKARLHDSEHLLANKSAENAQLYDEISHQGLLRKETEDIELNLAKSSLKEILISLDNAKQENCELLANYERVKQNNLSQSNDEHAIRELEEKVTKINEERISLQSVLNEKISELSVIKSEMHRMMAAMNMMQQQLAQAELENKNRPVVESVPTDDMSREAVKQLSQEVRSRDLELEALRSKCNSLTDILQLKSTDESSADTAPSSSSSTAASQQPDADAVRRLIDERDDQNRQLTSLLEERTTIIAALNNKHQEAVGFHAEASRLLTANQELVKEVAQLKWQHEKKTMMKDAAQIQLVNLQQQQQQQSAHTDASTDVPRDDMQHESHDSSDLLKRLHQTESTVALRNEEIVQLQHKLKNLEATTELADDILSSDERKFSLQLNVIQSELDDVKKERDEIKLRSSQDILQLREEVRELMRKIADLELQLKLSKEGESAASSDTSAAAESSRGQIEALQRDREQLLINLNHLENINLQFKAQTEEKHDQLIKADRELQRLRVHLVAIEDNYTKDAINNETREVALRSRLADTERQLETAVHGVKSVSAQSTDRVNNLTTRIESVSRDLETTAKQLKVSKRKENETSTSLCNLQMVLEQFQKERELQQSTETERYKRDLQVSTNENTELTKRLQLIQITLKDNEQALAAAQRLSITLGDRDETISALKEQGDLHRDELSCKNDQISKLKVSHESRIEKVMIKNMLVTYFHSPPNKKKEVIDLICKMLNFKPEELNQIGTESSGWMGKLFKNTDQKSAKLDGTFSELFVQFLEAESTPLDAAPTLELNRKLSSSSSLDGKTPSFSSLNAKKVAKQTAAAASVPLQITGSHTLITPLPLSSSSSSRRTASSASLSTMNAESSILKDVLDNN